MVNIPSYRRCTLIPHLLRVGCVQCFPFRKYNMGRGVSGNFTLEKPHKHHFHQSIKVNNSGKSYSWFMPLIGSNEGHFTLVVFIPQMYNISLILRKIDLCPNRRIFCIICKKKAAIPQNYNDNKNQEKCEKLSQSKEVLGPMTTKYTVVSWVGYKNRKMALGKKRKEKERKSGKKRWTKLS